MVFIAVGTPASRRGDGYADLSYVYEAARQMAPFLRDYTVVINKSTVPVGTAGAGQKDYLRNQSGGLFRRGEQPRILA